MNPDDVLVRDLAGQQQLALEAAFDLRGSDRILGDFRPNDLDRYRHAQFGVPGLIDRAHAANAKDPDDVVSRSERLTDFQRSGLGLAAGKSASPGGPAAIGWAATRGWGRQSGCALGRRQKGRVDVVGPRRLGDLRAEAGDRVERDGRATRGVRINLGSWRPESWGPPRRAASAAGSSLRPKRRASRQQVGHTKDRSIQLTLFVFRSGRRPW